MRFLSALATIAIALTPTTMAGAIAYGLCQTECNTVVVACYADAGAVFGTVVADAATLPALLACNAALGTCSVTCATVALHAPTP